MSRKGLQITLGMLGTVATVAGASGVLRGATEVIDGGRVSANVDNEYRFYAAWYHVVGLLLLGAAREPEAEAKMIRAAAAGFFIAACGRALSIRQIGKPHWFQRLLMGLEFAIPAVVLPWHWQVVKSAATEM